MVSVTITADRQDKKLEGYHLRATVAGVSDRVDGYIARRADGQWDVRARTGLHVNLRRLGLCQTRRHALNIFERFAETALKATTGLGNAGWQGRPGASGLILDSRGGTGGCGTIGLPTPIREEYEYRAAAARRMA
jgi:hypothetical protein